MQTCEITPFYNLNHGIHWRDCHSEGMYLQYDLAARHLPVRQQKDMIHSEISSIQYLL